MVKPGEIESLFNWINLVNKLKADNHVLTTMRNHLSLTKGQVSAQLHPYYKESVSNHTHWMKSKIDQSIQTNAYNISKYQQLVDSVKVNPVDS